MTCKTECPFKKKGFHLKILHFSKGTVLLI